MDKNYLLGGLLAFQAIAGYLVFNEGGELSKHSSTQKLFDFETSAVNGIHIEDAAGNKTELKRIDNSWRTMDDFPADSDRVDQLLSKLLGLEHGLAIAQSASAAERFEVSEDDFQRSVHLLNGQEILGSLYLGSGAGARRSHVRLTEDDSIYAVTIGTFELPAEISNWQDKNLLKINFDAVNMVQFDGLVFSRSENKDDNTDTREWSVAGLDHNEDFDKEAFESALKNLTSLRYNEAFTGSTENLSLGGEFTIEYADTKRSYQFYTSEGDDSSVLKVSDYGELFEITSFNAKRILENLNKEKLVSSTEAPSVEELPLLQEPVSIEQPAIN